MTEIMKKNPLRFEEENWRDLDELNKEETIVSLIISPLEEHGPHLPVGTDIFISKMVAEQVTKNLQKDLPDVQCLVLPIIPIGVAKPTVDFPGTISVQKKTIRNVLFDISKSLSRHGFKYLIIWTFHMDFKHLKAITQVIRKTHGRYKIRICEPLSHFFYTQDKQEITHAGKEETSYILRYHPQLLDEKYHHLSPVASSSFETIKMAYKTIKELGATQGYIGNPADASENMGDKLIAEASKYCTQYVKDWYLGKSVPKLPKKIRWILKFC
jgi:creatinine amidohydrolase